MRTVFRNSEIPGRIANLQPFLSVGTLPDGSRRWWATCGPAPDMGHLPRKYHDSARRAVYTVISYGTPIAWVWEREVGTDPYFYVLPDVGYSPTTGQQQYEVRDAWSTELKRQGTFPSLGHGRGREIVRVPGNAEVYGRERRLRAGGIDGAYPGSVVEDRWSAYEGVTDDAMHYTPSAVWPNTRSHP
jgi:hypothetical protein